jgi:hypothetical protein
MSGTETVAAVAVAEPTPNGQATEEAIRLCAYRKWEAAGKPERSSDRFWLEAEQELSRAK